jgi:hypothetical protein
LAGKSPLMCCAQRVARPAYSLPDDIDSLRALALNAIAECDTAVAERTRLIAVNEKLPQLCARRRASYPKASGWPICIRISSIRRLGDAEEAALLTRDKDAARIFRIEGAVSLVDIGALDLATYEPQRPRRRGAALSNP